MITRYDNYKDSGVEWLGHIPSQWEAVKLKFVGDAFIGLTYTPDDLVDDESNGMLVLRSSNIQDGKLSFSNNVYVSSKIPTKLILKPGDILLCSRNGSRELVGKNVIITEMSAEMTFGAFMTVFRTEYSGFIYYFFNSQIFKALSSLFLSSTINQLTLGVLNNMVIALPPKEEQTQIARYLDHETAIINRLIQQKEKLIELLKEKRESVINEVVTEGLDPSSKMKDSGIEWLGEIPEDWELKPLKHLASVKGRLGWKGLKAEEYVEYGYGFLSTPDIKNEIIDFKSINYITEERYLESPEIMLENDDVLLVKDGSTLGIVNYIRQLPFPTTVNSSIGIIRVFDKSVISPEYLFWQLKSNYMQTVINRLRAGQGVPHLFQKDIKNFAVLVPPIKIQYLIVELIKTKTKAINEIIEQESVQIEKLKEYRQSLISEAVTGKIDVREWQPNKQQIA